VSQARSAASKPPDLTGLRRAEAAIAELEEGAAQLQAAGRSAVGVVGRFELGPMSEALRASGIRWYPLVCLTVLGGVDILFAGALINAGGAISFSLGVPNLSLLVYIRIVGLALGGAAVLEIVRRSPPGGRVRRSRLAISAGGVGVVALLCAAFSRNDWALAGATALASVASGVTYAVHRPLLFDHYRPEVRIRALAAYGTGVMLGLAGASALIPVADGLGLTWRSVFAALAAVAAIGVATVGRLTDAAPAGWETRVISGLVERQLGPPGSGSKSPDPALTTAERFRQVFATSAALPLLTAASAFGLLVVTLPPYLLSFWSEHWRMGPDAGVGLFSGLCAASVASLVWFGRRGELTFRASPARMLRLAWRLAALGALALYLAAVIRLFAVMAGLLAIAFGALVVLLTAASAALLSAVRPANRAHASLALGVAVLQGGFTGNFLMHAFATRFGLAWAFLVAAFYVLGCGASASRAARTIESDVDDTVGALIAETELRTRASQGQHLPLLGVRHVDFSYGPLQVLFDVTFTVDDGEMVALLGTNGAGKSTLLRLISGISLPSRGSVHFRGSDVTHLGPDERVRLGISQVPGGRAVFGPMTVVENLRVFGYTHGRDRRRVEAGVEAGLAAFPSLASRADQPAATLSGGEQQMLGVAKAFVVPPRVLLIDELSLGLAPIVVGELLDTVRRINAEGTAVVIVEQSVNIALSLVDHAYFMEKGEVRFDGPAAQLAARPDLLRSVFLEGAAAATASDPPTPSRPARRPRTQVAGRSK
jgi:ABC-type branched-subunit amino acid transport system ATPase component